MTPQVVVRSVPGTPFQRDITAGKHTIRADEPVDAGGQDEGPGPYDLLLASLGACTSMTVSMYARRKQWPLERIEVGLRHERVHAKDCADCETKDGHIDRITIEVALDGPLSDEQRARLLEIAGKCPVHRTLTGEIKIDTRAVPKIG